MAYLQSNVMGVGRVGEYDRTLDPIESIAWRERARSSAPSAGPWTWQFYPPPYQFADPWGPLTPPPTFIAPAESMGLGCGCGCGGRCGCSGHGMGAIDWSPGSSDILAQFGFNLPNIVVYGVAALGAFWLFGPAQRKRRARRHFRRVKERLGVK